MPTWDRGISYKDTETRLLQFVEMEPYPERCYAAIALSALRSGLLIEDVMAGYRHFLETGQSEDIVIKKGEREYILSIPPEARKDREICRWLLKYDKKQWMNKLRHWFKRNFGATLFSLRYALPLHEMREKRSIKDVIIALQQARWRQRRRGSPPSN